MTCLSCGWSIASSSGTRLDNQLGVALDSPSSALLLNFFPLCIVRSTGLGGSDVHGNQNYAYVNACQQYVGRSCNIDCGH